MTKKILIVEDEYDVASTMELALEMENFEVRICYNGAEAMDVLSNEALPSLIISDIMMPIMDGYAFAKALRSNKKYDHIPLLLASAGKIDSEKLLNSNPQGFIRKPFDLDDFIDLVNKSLRQGK